MRLERSIDIDAPQERVWDVRTDLEAGPRRIDTVDEIELLAPAPLTWGSRVRLKQPKLNEAVWEVTAWDAPSYFEWTTRRPASPPSPATGWRRWARAVLADVDDRHGRLPHPDGLVRRGLTSRYLAREAEGMKRASHSGTDRSVVSMRSGSNDQRI